LEELTKNQTIPKALIEDIKWAIKALNTNKLFKNKSGGFKIPKDREDSKAWYNLLNMPSSLIINKNGEGMGNAFNLSNHAPSGLDIDQRENNVKNSSFGGPSRKDSRMDLNRKKNFSPMRARDSQDELDPFFDLIDETDARIFENALENFDETQFDSFAFTQIIGENSFQFLMYKIFSIYNIMDQFNIPLKKL